MPEIVDNYNNDRPHLSCNLLTPKQAHLKQGAMKKKWKTYYRKRKLEINA